MNDKQILITGATSGIGLAAAAGRAHLRQLPLRKQRDYRPLVAQRASPLPRALVLLAAAHPNARLGILGHARAHRFRTRPALPSRHGPRPNRCRALELLASSRNGATEAIMLVHGFTVEQMIDLCISGLVTATSEHMIGGGRMFDVVRMTITEAGQRVLEDWNT